MDEKEHREKLERQSNEIYLEIGRFVVTFEHLMQSVRDGIYFSPERARASTDHVTEQAQTYARLAKCSVDVVLDEFLGLAGKTTVATHKGIKLVHEVVDASKAVNAERNAAVHNTWMVGYASAEGTDFSTIWGFRHARQKGDVKFEATQKTAAGFASLTERAKRLKQQFEIIHMCAAFGDSYEAHLKYDESGRVVTYNLPFRDLGAIAEWAKCQISFDQSSSPIKSKTNGQRQEVSE